MKLQVIGILMLLVLINLNLVLFVLSFISLVSLRALLKLPLLHLIDYAVIIVNAMWIVTMQDIFVSERTLTFYTMLFILYATDLELEVCVQYLLKEKNITSRRELFSMLLRELRIK